jgi:hypothetical protein
MRRMIIGCADELTLEVREREIYHAAISCLNSRKKIMQFRDISGWTAAALISVLIELTTRNIYLVLPGAILIWWLTRRLVYGMLRSTFEQVGELMLTFKREPSGVSLVEKISRGNARFIRGDRSGAAYSLHMMHDRILDPFCWSNGLLASQFLRVQEPEPFLWSDGSVLKTPTGYSLSNSPFFN